MRQILLALAISLISFASFAAPAAAKCPTCLDGISVQTPDGQPWSEGKPVTGSTKPMEGTHLKE